MLCVYSLPRVVCVAWAILIRRAMHIGTYTAKGGRSLLIRILSTYTYIHKYAI